MGDFWWAIFGGRFLVGDFWWAILYGRLCMGDFCSGHVLTHENVNSFVIVVRVNGENEN